MCTFLTHPAPGAPGPEAVTATSRLCFRWDLARLACRWGQMCFHWPRAWTRRNAAFLPKREGVLKLGVFDGILK